MNKTKLPAFKKVGVLMGGVSAEREISLRSGHAVLAALQAEGIHAVGIDLQHDWINTLSHADIDAAFIALHGTWGEDGCIQGLLEIMSIPYTGSGVTASALCMDKKLTKHVLAQANIKTPIDITINHDGPARYPVFIKPVDEGSSVGLHYIESKKDWDALALPKHHWMAEMPAKGVEIAVSVINGKALVPVEVSPKSGVYDFHAKYTQGATEYFCPARLPAETLRYCMQEAERAVQATQCKGAPRVDMIVDNGGNALVLEINTIPGMTETSLLPKAALASNMSFQQLCIEILASASLEHRGVAS